MSETNSCLPGCDACSVTVDSKGEKIHEPTCLRQKHNRFKEAIEKALEELGNAVGEAKWGD
jgi:hypothetical protein